MYVSSKSETLFNTPEVTNKLAFNHLNNLDTTKATDTDEINAVKKSAPIVTENLTHILNLSLAVRPRNDKFQSPWKRAKVILIFIGIRVFVLVNTDQSLFYL